MVRIGIATDQFSSQPRPKTYPDMKAVLPVDGAVFIPPSTVTDSVGSGYTDATPILVPTTAAPGAVVNTTPKLHHGLQGRRNTRSNPPEIGGPVMMDVIPGTGNIAYAYRQRVAYTPPQVMP